MKIKNISLSTLNREVEIRANYTPGDVETLTEEYTDEDYMLMPTREVAALVEAAGYYHYGVDHDIGCDCDNCAFLEFCDGCDGCKDDLPIPLFGGAFYDAENNFIYITKVVYDAPKTVVIWSDGTKTSSTCGENDTYNPEMGLALAVLKKLVSSEFAVKTLHDWAPVDNKTTRMTKTLKDVRRDHKVTGNK